MISQSMEYKLRRKIDDFLINWKKNPDRMPLIIKSARQVGKTSSIEHFAKNYKNFGKVDWISLDKSRYKRYFNRQVLRK